MKPVDYVKAFPVLPPYCLALMQNVSAEDQQGLARDLKTLDERQIDPVIRSQLPGLALLTVVGSDVFR